jgi:hypothetical protein
MAKAGRKLKQNVQRHACGKIKKPADNDRGIMLVAADLAAIQQMRLDPIWRTQLGRLTASGDLSLRQMAAAKKLLRHRAEADRILLLPNRHPKAMDMNAIGGRDVDDEAHLTQEQLEEKGRVERSKTSKVYEAEAKLGNGSQILAAVQSVVYYDLAPCGYQQLLDLREGLRILCEFWKIG